MRHGRFRCQRLWSELAVDADEVAFGQSRQPEAKIAAMRRKLLMALGLTALIVASLHVGTRVIGRRMLIAQCAKDDGVLEDRGVFGESRCVVR